MLQVLMRATDSCQNLQCKIFCNALAPLEKEQGHFTSNSLGTSVRGRRGGSRGGWTLCPCTADQRGGGYHRLKVKQDNKEAPLASANPWETLLETFLLQASSGHWMATSAASQVLQRVRDLQHRRRLEVSLMRTGLERVPGLLLMLFWIFCSFVVCIFF